MIQYTQNKFEKIQEKFPNLYYIKNKETIEGELNFCSRYNKITCNNISKWDIEFCDNNKDEYVEDVYSIRICLDKKDRVNGFPVVFETDDRIKNLAKSLGKSLNDLHLNNPDKSCCLGIFVPSYCPSLYDFVIKVVYPYFVWQAYFEKYRKIPPCGQCPHNPKDAIDIRIKDEENNRKFFLAQHSYKPSGNNRNKLCLCGSGKKSKKCCLRYDKKASKSASYLKGLSKDRSNQK